MSCMSCMNFICPILWTYAYTRVEPGKNNRMCEGLKTGGQWLCLKK